MKLSIKSIFVIMLMSLITIGGTTSCNSKKKMAKKEYAEKLETAKRDLNAIIEGTTQWTLDDQFARVDEIEKMVKSTLKARNLFRIDIQSIKHRPHYFLVSYVDC